jgi:hypothetical protein
MKTSRLLSLLACVLLALLAFGARAAAAAEPTVHQIYEAADRGDVRGAQAMIDEVIARHPNSARAHFVKAELAARARDAATGRAELQAAEKLAPGLPFAKPEAVSSLRAQLDRLSARAPAPAPAGRPATEARRMSGPPSGSGFPWGPVLLVAAAVIGVVLLLRRRSAPPSYAPPGASPYARDDAFGRAQPLYGPDGRPLGAQQPMPGYPQQTMPGYPQPQGGLGSGIVGGLATGLALGAGAVAAQEIGRRMFEHGSSPEGHRPPDPALPGHAPDAQSPLARDAGIGAFGADPGYDMGGQDFGLADGAGWDDAAPEGDGGDWDT